MTVLAVSEEATEDRAKIASDWQKEIDRYEQNPKRMRWVYRARQIIKRYRDDRNDETGYASKGKFNIFWSNVETLAPSLYGQVPQAIVERRYLDKDPVGRVAASILERGLRYEIPTCGFNEAIEQAVKDLLLPGRGTAWVRFEPEFGPPSSPDETTAGIEDEEPQQTGAEVREDIDEDETTEQELIDTGQLTGACLDVDHVNWEDFLHSEGRVWKEVTWVGRRLSMDRDALVKLAGEEIGMKVPMDTGERRRGQYVAKEEQRGDKATVYEIWNKPDRKVYFIVRDFNEPLKVEDDPLHLEGFWPCPKPLFATMTNDTLIPVPDYVEYQDQALQLDELTRRIDLLMKALSVRGVYNGANKQLARLLDEGVENKLIAVDSWAAFGEKGGLKGAVDFLPIEMIANVLMGLFKARDQIKADLYEITGIADVVRGQSDPDETAAAQKMKGSFVSIRLRKRQREVARFARDIIAIMGEIMAEHFPAETLIQISGAQYEEGIGPDLPEPPQEPQIQPPTTPEEAQMAQQAIGQYQAAMAQYQAMAAQAEMETQQKLEKALGLLRDEKLRGFRIDIETDSTIAMNEEEEKTARIEFIGAASGFLKQSMEAAQAYPQIVPLLGKMMMFAIRGFRTGRDLESAFEEFIDQAQGDAVKIAQQKGSKPDPEQIKAQTEAAKAQAEINKAEVEAKSEENNATLNYQSKQLEFKMKQLDADAKERQAARDAQYADAAHNDRMQELALKREIVLIQHGVNLREAAVQQQAQAQPEMAQ